MLGNTRRRGRLVRPEILNSTAYLKLKIWAEEEEEEKENEGSCCNHGPEEAHEQVKRDISFEGENYKSPSGDWALYSPSEDRNWERSSSSSAERRRYNIQRP